MCDRALCRLAARLARPTTPPPTHTHTHTRLHGHGWLCVFLIVTRWRLVRYLLDNSRDNATALRYIHRAATSQSASVAHSAAESEVRGGACRRRPAAETASTDASSPLRRKRGRAAERECAATTGSATSVRTNRRQDTDEPAGADRSNGATSVLSTSAPRRQTKRDKSCAATAMADGATASTAPKRRRTADDDMPLQQDSGTIPRQPKRNHDSKTRAQINAASPASRPQPKRRGGSSEAAPKTGSATGSAGGVAAVGELQAKSASPSTR